MTRKELSEKIEDAISIYETDEVKPYEVKRDGLLETIRLCREYIEVYKVPYKHKFYGSWYSYSLPLLHELEKMTHG